MQAVVVGGTEKEGKGEEEGKNIKQTPAEYRAPGPGDHDLNQSQMLSRLSNPCRGKGKCQGEDLARWICQHLGASQDSVDGVLGGLVGSAVILVFKMQICSNRIDREH